MIIPLKLKKEIKKDKEVLAVILYGSYARKESYKDIDLCLVLVNPSANLLMSKKRLKYLSLAPEKFDIQIFQQLPLYIRKRILKEGKVIICKNESLLYELAFLTIKEFEMYKKAYYSYLKSLQDEKEKVIG